MKYALIVLSLALLNSCVTSSKTILPNGQTGYSIKCRGTANSWGNCMKKAGELCGGAYDIYTQDSQGALVITKQFAGATIHRELIVGCK